MRLVFFYGAVGLSVSTLGYLSIKKVTHELGAVDAYSCHFCSACSQSMQEKVRSYIAQETQLPSLPLAVVAHTLAQKFPSLKKVSCTKDGAKIVQIYCQNAQPLFCLNDTHVFTDTDRVIEKECFSPESVSSLPSIAVVAVSQGVPVLSAQAKKSMHTVFHELFDRYQMTWIDDTQVLLREKNSSSFSLVFNTDSLPDKKIIRECEQIKKEFESSGLIVPQGKKRWVADMRFANQIILSADTGGRFNG